MEKLSAKFFSGLLAASMSLSGFPNFTYAQNDDLLRNNNEVILKTVFDTPSKDWESECTQLGNGFLGAMIYGGYAVDQIQLNENSIWDGGPASQAEYSGGNGGSAEQNYKNLSSLRDYLQGTMADFTQNHSAYIDSSGNVVSSDYPNLSAEAQGWLDSLKGAKTYFGHYQPMGDMYVSDYITPEIKKNNSYMISSNEEQNTTAANLFDGDAATDWTSINTNMPVTAEITYDEPVTFKSYKLTSSSERYTEGNTPSKWTLYGSEDGIEYDVIDSRENVKFDRLGESRIFELNSEVSYKYFRFAAERANKNGSVIKLSELSFMPKAEFDAETAVYSGYKRVLDMNNSLASVTYRKNGVRYDREYFASYPNNFMAMHLTVDKENALDKYIYLDTIHNDPKIEADVQGNIGSITMTFNVGNQAIKEKVACQLRIIADDGAAVSYDPENPKYVHVENANDIKVYMTGGTNYIECMDDSFDYLSDEEPINVVKERLDTVQDQDYETLKAIHTEDYRNLFTRVSLELNGADFPAYMTTRELVNGYKAGTNTDQENRYLEMLYYQMGRYLMISGSREGSLPLNLQGIWNNSMTPPWRSGYTTNINAEMNYWLAETTNLSECHEPMTTFIKAQIPRGKKTAQLYHYDVDTYEATGEYKPARGWVCYHNLNIWGNTAPDKSSCFYFPTAAAWLCQDIWEHYAFTLDKEFLNDNFYILKEASLFWVDNLVTDERDGMLVSSPGHSPEHGGITMGTTGDQMIIWELFNNTLKAAEALGIEDSEIEEIKEAMSKLSMPKIGLAGQFQEWKDEVTLDITGHSGYKHVTHMFALYPGSFVVPGRSEQDDTYADALRTSLNVRGDGGTGWGKAWKIGLWARARDGERAGKMVSSIISGSTLVNLFDTHTPFQIDGNFGATAGMTEMMLQSQGDSVELIPAIPSMWSHGSVKGLRARGGITVDVDWSDKKVTHAAVVSETDNDKLSVSGLGIADMKVYDSKNKEVEFTTDTKDKISFSANAGERYTIASGGNNNTFMGAKAYVKDKKVIKTVLEFDETVSQNISAYYAAYDKNGRLMGVSKKSGAGNNKEIIVNVPENVISSNNIEKELLYVWNDSMAPITDAIDVRTLPTEGGEVSTPEPTKTPDPDYFINENFNNIRGDWGFTGKDRTYISDSVLKFAGGGAGESDTKTMDSAVTECRALNIEFDWRSDTDLSSSGRAAAFELMDKNHRTFFAMYGNTRSSEGIKYTTNKNAFDDEGLAYKVFPVAQGKNSEWYHISLTVNFANSEIASGTVERDSKVILTLSNEPIEAENLAYMRMADVASVSGMSIDNVKISKADMNLSDDTSLKSAVIKGKASNAGASAKTPEEITEFEKIRVSGEAAVNPYKLTEFVPNYVGAEVKAVKYNKDIKDYSGFDMQPSYNDENIEHNDTFIIRVTAENGDTAYFGIIAEVSDGSDEAYLETFEINSGDQNLVKDFVFNKDIEAGGSYGSAEVTKNVETVSLKFTTSDERLMSSDNVGNGGVVVSVNGNTGAYDKATGAITLSSGDNMIEISVTSYDGTTNGKYTLNVCRTEYIMIEKFESDIPSWWYSQYTTIEISENGTIYFDQGNGTGPRSARGWAFENAPIASGNVEVDFDLKMTSGNNESGGDTAFFIVGSKADYKGNGYFSGTGGIIGIQAPAKATEEKSMRIISGSGDIANPAKTAINNPMGSNREFPWASVKLVIDLAAQRTKVRIVSRDNTDDVWFDGTVDGFIDSSVSDMKGFQLTMGRAYGNQEIDNLKVKAY